jgi:hypothetical protein
MESDPGGVTEKIRGRGEHAPEQFDFKTLPPALDFDTSFAGGAGGGIRRQSISTFQC